MHNATNNTSHPLVPQTYTSVQDKCCMTAALLPQLVHMGVDGNCLNKAKDQCYQAHLVEEQTLAA